MGLFDRKRHRREDMALLRRMREDSEERPWYQFSPLVWESLVILTLSAILSLICFWDRPAHLPLLVPGTEVKIAYEAPFEFTYPSATRRKQRIEEARLNIEPVYRVAFDEKRQLTPYRDFARLLPDMFSTIRQTPEERRSAVCLSYVKGLPGVSTLLAKDLAEIATLAPDEKSFTEWMRTTTNILEQILITGIYERGSFDAASPNQGVERTTAARNLHDALEKIIPSDAPANAASLRSAVYSFFRSGLTPNVEINLEETRKLQDEAASRIEKSSITETIYTGDLLLRPGETVTPAVMERWDAYRKQFADHERATYGPFRALEENFGTALGVVLLAAAFLHIAPPGRLKRRQISLIALLVPANLLLIRLFLSLSETSVAISIFEKSEVLFWLAPPALAAILVTMLGGTYLALLGAFMVSMFSALMLGRTLDTFLITAVANLTGIFFCRNVQSRSAVLRAGTFSGIVVALPIFFLGKTGGMAWQGLTLQIGGCLACGIATGMFAIGVLPVLERVFKLTSNITFIELNNDSHELLRKLQIIAPGTFNHSANVANLAADAATRIGANALLCRCAALFHDIGKMGKPEYFVENQQAGNPHTDINPTMSAIIIKSHVREGSIIAKEYGLPRAIIDIIEQHHGTGLIQYFFHKAKTAASADAPAKASAASTAVSEESFRYDGPRPRSREAAIILFADSLEAASRSLKKVTPKTVGDLVDAIVADRIKDGQLDECPLTFNEVLSIRESLKASLLHMYHHRIEYPKEEGAK
jgi:putative nucleotidyltransferase with HDIG domain